MTEQPTLRADAWMRARCAKQASAEWFVREIGIEKRGICGYCALHKIIRRRCGGLQFATHHIFQRNFSVTKATGFPINVAPHTTELAPFSVIPQCRSALLVYDIQEKENIKVYDHESHWRVIVHLHNYIAASSSFCCCNHWPPRRASRFENFSIASRATSGITFTSQFLN